MSEFPVRLYAVQEVLGLHQTLEVIYIVDGYSASIINEKQKTIYEATGKTIHEAMANLETNVILRKELST